MTRHCLAGAPRSIPTARSFRASTKRPAACSAGRTFCAGRPGGADDLLIETVVTRRGGRDVEALGRVRPDALPVEGARGRDQLGQPLFVVGHEPGDAVLD